MSTVHDMYAKLSGHEARAWIDSCVHNWTENGWFSSDIDAEELTSSILACKPVGFKNPRRARTSKSSSSERSAAEYQCGLCDARIWADGFGAQCSRKKLDGKSFCATHCKEADKNSGELRNGLITQDRPSHPYGDDSQPLLPWHDVEIVKVKKSSKSSELSSDGSEKPARKPRKCGCCGQFGHNVRTCPNKASLSNTSEESVANSSEESVANIVGELRTLLQPVTVSGDPSTEETTEETTEVVEQSPESDDGAGVGFIQQSSINSLVSDVVSDIVDAVETDLSSPQLEEDLSVHTDSEDEAESSITWQGIKYTIDAEEGTVHDDELTEIGTWDGQKIKFVSPQESKLHRLRVLELKESSE